MADTLATSIDWAEHEQLFGWLSVYDDIFLAVSGGVDSCALMHLAAQWRARTRWSGALHVLCVDHGLRPEAADEARQVVAQARGLSLPAHVLTWEGCKPASGIQEAARSARYQLMLDHIRCVSADPARAVLVTAHHRDDLAETLLMRLARGAGVDGLSAMQRLTCRDGIALARPLLGVTKARLRDAMVAAGARWREDPSNADPAFERVQLRSARQARVSLRLDDDKLALTARRMQRARVALERMADDWLVRHLDQPLLGRCGVFTWPWPIGEVPDEVAVRALMRLLPGIGGSGGPLRLLRVERLWDDMQHDGFAGATLGNCVVTGAIAGSMYIYREPRRAVLPVAALEPGRALIWDNRFEIKVPRTFSGRLQARPLVRADLRVADPSLALLQRECPMDALWATPVIADQSDILAIPALNVHRPASGAPLVVPVSCRFLVERLGCGGIERPGRSDCATD